MTTIKVFASQTNSVNLHKNLIKYCVWLKFVYFLRNMEYSKNSSSRILWQLLDAIVVIFQCQYTENNTISWAQKWKWQENYNSHGGFNLIKILSVLGIWNFKYMAVSHCFLMNAHE